MAIQYVGGTILNFAGRTSNTVWPFASFPLTGGIASAPAARDLVIVTYGIGQTAAYYGSVVTAGYTMDSARYANDTYDASLTVSWKIMGDIPDTDVTVTGSGSTANAGCITIQVFRGVDVYTPLDVVSTGQVYGNQAHVVPSPITPVSADNVIFVTGASATVVSSSYSNIGSYSGFVQIYTSDTTGILTGSGFITGQPAGVAYTPAVWLASSSGTANSVATATMALRAAINSSSAVTGVQAVGSVGSVATTGGANSYLTGVEATSFFGTVDTKASANVSLSGLLNTMYIGDISVYLQTFAYATGVSASGSANAVSTIGNANIYPTGLLGDAQNGNVSIYLNLSVLVSGVLTTASVGSVLARMWSSVADVSVTYTPVVPSSTSGYTPVTPNATDVWTPITHGIRWE